MTNRRASLPGADELFRSTVRPPETGTPVARSEAAAAMVDPGDTTTDLQVDKETRGGTGARRPRHEEKVTFYCTGAELTRLERARLALRADHGLGTDRGRIVRAALEEILKDFEDRGSESALVRRLGRRRS